VKLPLRVLIAEDSPADAELILRELRRAGYEPAWERVDTEAAYLARLRPDLDLILSDYDMPQFSGPRALELLQECGLEIPFIIISGTIGEETAVAMMQARATDYLLKDRLARLGTAVSQALEQSRLRRERRGREDELRLFRTLVDQSDDTFEVVDPQTGRFLDVNESGCLKLGYSREEYLSLHVWDVDPLLTEADWPQVAEQMRMTGSLSRGGLHRQDKEGRTFPIELNARWVRTDRDYVVAVVRDITERKRAEERAREQDEAERTNRAKSEFLSHMSHELRTPLHAILGFTQLLETEGQSPADAESVEQIARAGNHLLGLINEVLDLARIEADKREFTPEPVQVRETLQEALSLVKPLAAERRVRLEPLAGDPDCEVLSSARRFRQVILNLLSNAVKFNREGGAVTVSWEKIGDCLRIKVADTGRGISAGNLAKLFVPFERLGDTVSEGAGLGLSLSKDLIEAMGGRIGVESVPGQGTTFWVELPLAPARPATTALDAPPPAVAEGPRCTAPRTLLYVEDNLSNLRLVERILDRRPEVKLISAMQGRTGLELARQHQPDLLMLDLHLPDLPGEEILRQLRADPRTAQLPIVMISADATSTKIERLRAAGASDYLTKPIDVRRFLALVDATPPRRAETVPQPCAPHPEAGSEAGRYDQNPSAPRTLPPPSPAGKVGPL
jgi:PAS domain S-box-containing protein